MNWQDDPELQKAKLLQAARGRLLRSVIIWSPFFLLALGALLFFTFDRAFQGGDNGSTWFLVVVLTVLTLLFGFQAIQSLLDLVGQPKVRTGVVTRRWARSDSFVVKTHYVRIGKTILRGDQFVLDGIREGDYVEATYYPHSAVLTWIEQRERPAEGSEGMAPQLSRD